MIHPNELKAEEIRSYTHQILKKHVPLKVHGTAIAARRE